MSQMRYLWQLLWRCETREGRAIVSEAMVLALDPRYRDLSAGELIRLVYWGASGSKS